MFILNLNALLKSVCGLFVAALLLLVSSSSLSQDVNPLAGDARAQYAGGVLFRAQCATCHGADATGIESITAPDLTRMWRERGYSDAQVFTIIRNGIAGTIMPGHEFTDTETWMLVSFLRSVGESGVTDLPVADAAEGERLFAAQCAECHRVAGLGGVLGPNLSALLLRNSLDDIRLAIRQPDATIVPGYKSVLVNTPGGERIEGVLKNEDAFSFQIVDNSQQLKAFRKQRAVLERRSTSLMPAFTEAELSDRQLLAILNYIRAMEGTGQ